MGLYVQVYACPSHAVQSEKKKRKLKGQAAAQSWDAPTLGIRGQGASSRSG